MKKYSYINKIKPIQIFTFTKLNLNSTNWEICRDQLKGKSGLYGLINLDPNNNKLLYIGKSIKIWDRILRHSKNCHNTELRNAIEKNGFHNFIIVVFIFDPSYSPPCLDFKFKYQIQDQIQDQIKNQNKNQNQIKNQIKNQSDPVPSGQGKIEFEKELKRLEFKCIKSFDRKYLFNEKIKANKNEGKLSLEQYKNNRVVDVIIIPFLKALINKKLDLELENFRSWSYENILNWIKKYN